MEGNTLTNEKRFYPLLVSSSGLETQSDQESEQVWGQLDRLPVNNKKILLSASIIQSLWGAEQKFRWEPYYSARLSYFVRELFFQNISQSEFYKAVEALFDKQYRNQFNEILSYINNAILTAKPDPDEPEEEELENPLSKEQTKQHALLDALSKYPNLSNQTITTERIILKSSRDPVRPTLSNWLKNYRDELGIGRHDAVARAKFLFESQNTKKLPSEERDRIHMLVRSLEDDELLTIDTKKQEIIFLDEKKEGQEEAQPQINSPAQSTPSPDIFERFQNISEPSYPEELKNVGTPTFAKALPNQAPVLTRGGENTKREPKKDEQTILARIKSMLVSAPKANAPAPREDFSEAPEPAKPPLLRNEEPEPLGTLRFSAKHVLPRERQIREIPSVSEVPKKDSRLEHFRPEPVPIPGEPPAPTFVRAPEPQPVFFRSASTPPPVRPSVSRPETKGGEKTIIPTPPPQSVSPVPEEKEEYVASNMFRIKPSRE